MYLEKVVIKGFRNFKDATINFGQHSLLIGANDVGKSNMLYAMRILLDKGLSDYDFELKDSDFFAYEDTDEVEITIYFKDITEDCILARMQGNISDDGELVLRYSAKRQHGHVDYQFYCGRSDSEEDLKECDGPYYRKYLNIKYISSRRDFWSYINKTKNILLNEAKENREPDEVAADDTLYGQIADRLQYVDENIPRLSYVENATNKINQELDKLSIHNREQRLVFDTASTDLDRVITSVSIVSKHVDKKLFVGGDGRANQIYLSLWASQNQQDRTANEVSIICIEEPEAYLHPHQQRELAAYLGRTLNGQTILTSHSPFIVSEFSPNSIVRLYKTKGNETLAASDGCSHIIEEGIEGLGYRMSVIPAEAFFSDCVVLVEGPSEEMFYKVLAKQIGISLDRLNISVISVNGIGFKTYIAIMDAMMIDWVVRTDNDIMKIPKKQAYRYAGLERGLGCLEAGCNVKPADQEKVDEMSKLIHGFPDKDNIPENVIEAATWLKKFMAGYDILIADVDLETDMINSELHDALKDYYDEDDEMSDEEIIQEMKKQKAINMYDFLKAQKTELSTLVDDNLSLPLRKAQEFIEEHYGTYANPA